MSYANIIGRGKEIEVLDRVYKSRKSEFDFIGLEI